MDAHLHYKNEVKSAIENNQPIVALESTVITHGMPKPKNYETAIAMEESVRSAGAIPATIAIYAGEIKIGLTQGQLGDLAASLDVIKVSRRDIAGTLIKKSNGGTTVSGTMTLATLAGLKVFATGGIGGVHRGNLMDVSADLPTLAKLPLIVVCSGAKSILDLPSTREYLETAGIPVVGYQTDDFPAFYSTSSGLKVDYRFDSVEEVAHFARLHWSLGLNSAILVTVPVPSRSAISVEEMDEYINQAMDEMQASHIIGAATTPFLLKRVSELSGEKSLRSNIDLLINNASVAGKIAVELYR